MKIKYKNDKQMAGVQEMVRKAWADGARYGMDALLTRGKIPDPSIKANLTLGSYDMLAELEKTSSYKCPQLRKHFSNGRPFIFYPDL